MVARGTPLLLLGRNVLERVLWAGLRKDKGYSYYVDVGGHHSVLFPGYGYFWAQWSAGKYRSKPDDKLNIIESLKDASISISEAKVSS